MSDKEVRVEICRVFSKQMGLTSLDFDRGDLFPFKYLQRIGAGSRTLSVPSSLLFELYEVTKSSIFHRFRLRISAAV